MAAEVAPAGLGDLEVLAGNLLGLGADDIVSGTSVLAGDVGLDVLVGLLNIAGDVEGVAGGLGDGQTVWVEVLVEVTRASEDCQERQVMPRCLDRD